MDIAPFLLFARFYLRVTFQCTCWW